MNYFVRVIVNLLIIFLLIGGSNSYGQLVVDNTAPNNSPAYLVQNVLLGQGVTVSNISFTLGDSLFQIGYFNGAASNIGLNEGIILSSGDVNIAVGPNSTGSAGLAVGGPGDVDLTTIAGVNTFDAAILEFDFIPSGDTVKFRYVFGSEEYPEYVNSGVNDAFGFFISGPGYAGPYQNGAENIALIPGTTTPVTIDDVNHLVNTNYYVDNTGGNSVQYDGFTTVLEAVAVVQCGQQYHIRIAIADAGDAIYDSGVFLEAESFSSEDLSVNLEAGISTLTINDSTVVDSAIVRGCTEGVLSFIRPDTTGDLTIHFDLAGSAVNGVDYATIADSITIYGGDTSAYLVIEALVDTVPQGIDTLTISIEKVNACGDTFYIETSIYIVDAYEIVAVSPDVISTCPGDTVEVIAEAISGIMPYNYLWNTGDSTQSIFVAPFATDSFLVTITDSCGVAFAVDTIVVIMDIPPPVVDAGNDTVFNCPGAPVLLTASASGGNPGYSFQWSSGGSTDTTTVYPQVTDTFYVTVSDACGYINDVDTVIYEFVTGSLAMDLENDTIYCPGQEIIIPVSGSGTLDPYTFTWSTGDTTDTLIAFPVNDTTFFVTMTDNCGTAPEMDSVFVKYIPGVLTVDMSNDTTIVCPNQSLTLFASGSGTSAPYNYYWSTGEYTDTISFQVLASQTYYVTVTDSCGTVPVIDSVVVNLNTQAPGMTVNSSSDTITCPGDPVNITANGSGGVQPYNFIWNTGETTSGITVNPVASDTFIVSMTDYCGYLISDTVIVALNTPMPALTVSEDTFLLCVGDTGILYAEGSGGTPPYYFTWSTGATADSLVVIPPNTTDYFVTMTDDCGAIQLVDTIRIYLPSQLGVNASDPVVACAGLTADISANGVNGRPGYSYEWSNGETTSSFTDTVSGTITYQVTVTDVCGVTASDNVTATVAVYDPLIVSITPGNAIATCPGDDMLLEANASGGNDSTYSYYWEWSGGSGNNSSFIIGPVNDQEVVSVTVTDICGNKNSSSTSVFLPQYDPVKVTVDDYHLICQGRTQLLVATAEGGYGQFTYLWEGEQLNLKDKDSVSAVPASFGEYEYIVTATDACGNTGTAKSVVNAEDCSIWIPNVITPNGDLSNQYFIVKNLERYPSAKLIIFNRWGDKVYESAGYKNDWDGRKNNGKLLNDGVYFYILDVEEEEVHQGTVTVIR